MHAVLARQLRKLGLSAGDAPPSPEAWRTLLSRVSETYDSADQDRALVERSLEISSREMAELTAQLQAAERSATAERDRALASEERYRSLVELSPVGVVVLREGCLDFANPAALRLLAPAGGLAPGSSFRELVAPDSRPRLDALLSGPRGENDGSLCVLHLPRPGGGRFEVEAMVSDLQGAAGTRAMLLVLHDLSARRDAERRLQESEDMLARLADVVQQVFWITRPGAEPFLYVSPAYDRIWGRPREQLFRDRGAWRRAIHPEDVERVLAAAGAHEESGAYDETYRILRPDGVERWIRDRAYPVRDESGAVVRVYGIAEDITEFRAAQEGLRRAELHLRQAQKMEAVGRLAGGVAHDFNNILSVILGYGAMIQTRLHPEDPVQEFLGQVIAAGERAKRLTGQLLSFSRRRVVEAVPLDLSAVVRELLPMLGRLLGEDISLTAHLPEGLGTVLADRGQMDQVVMNLVVNARDAMPQGGQLMLGVEAVELDETSRVQNPDATPGPHVMLSLTDTGCGMSKAVLDHIFEPFFTTKPPEKGTGLGLSTVYGIVRQAAGHVTVYSEVGKGTTFRVYLPRFSAPAIAAGKSEAPLALTSESGRVLVVEDDPIVRRLASQILESVGIDVVACAGAAEARMAVEAASVPFDALITDVVMPETSGPDLARSLQDHLPDLKVVLMSGYAGAALNAQGTLVPEHVFLDKPFTPRTLLEALHRARDAGRSTA